MSPDAIEGFLGFLSDSTSPWHAAERIATDLVRAGFRQVGVSDPVWPSEPGGKFFLRRGAAVVAWIVPREKCARLVLGLAHTDSPCLRLKPNAEFQSCGCRKLALEAYGGLLNHTWLDRELVVSGRVCRDDGGWIREDLVKLDTIRPIVPSLAIHLDRTVNEKGLVVDRERHFPALFGLEDAASLKDRLADALNASSSQILSWDLCLSDAAPAALAGSGDLVVSGRLDNLASCHAMSTALSTLAARSDTLVAVAFLDGEEVGSTAAVGADSAFLPQTLERIAAGAGLDRSAFLAWVSGGIALSADMAHAVHPNFPERHSPGNAPLLGGGPVLKWNAGLRYATEARGAAVLRQVARDAAVGLQNFSMRADLACGSTVGPLVAAQLSVEAVDCGAPMLAMHSARETMAVRDQIDSISLYSAFLAKA
jgi:aspartyl aminopeptidase